MNTMCSSNDMCRYDGVMPKQSKSSWFCVVSSSKKFAKGPYPDSNLAKNELNKSLGSWSNRQMICEMSASGVKNDPRTVGGQNQGGGALNGFQKYWRDEADMQRMNGMCNVNKHCR